MPRLKYALIVTLTLVVTSCKWWRPIVRNIPKESNAGLFAKRPVNRGDEIFCFKDPGTNRLNGTEIRVEEKNIDPKGVTLDELVRLHHTLSLLIIRNDSLLYERYAANVYDTTRLASFSIAKSFVSALIGICIDKGEIRDVHQSIRYFIPELPEQFDPITILHLLKHTSGIGFTKGPLDPNSDNAQYYYTKDLRLKLHHMKIESAPGLHFNYGSINYQLLGLIIERATGHNLSYNLQERIWKPLQMENGAFWNLDNSGDSAMEKAFCCLNATTRDFAKLGRLYLENGNWNGKQVISENWIRESINPDTVGGGRYNFQYNWLRGPRRYNTFYAAGLYGQYVYVIPDKKIIIVRLGREDLNYNPAFWKETFLQVADQL